MNILTGQLLLQPFGSRLSRAELPIGYAFATLARENLNIGQRQRATTRIANTAGTNTRVMVQAWLGIPGKKVQLLDKTHVTGLHTIGAGLVSNRAIFNQVFTAADPVGMYSMEVQLLDPIMGQRIGNENVNRFVFTGQ